MTVVTKEELREGAGLGVSLILGMLSWTARQGSEGDAPLCTEGGWQPQREGATAMGELKDRLTDEGAVLLMRELRLSELQGHLKSF